MFKYKVKDILKLFLLQHIAMMKKIFFTKHFEAIASSSVVKNETEEGAVASKCLIIFFFSVQLHDMIKMISLCNNRIIRPRHMVLVPLL